jgi:hypothetical protein
MASNLIQARQRKCWIGLPSVSACGDARTVKPGGVTRSLPSHAVVSDRAIEPAGSLSLPTDSNTTANFSGDERLFQ